MEVALLYVQLSLNRNMVYYDEKQFEAETIIVYISMNNTVEPILGSCKK